MSTKVRIACRRCRTKRIKCDGGTPACSNCSKAGEPCIDVDGRNKTVSIPRDFAANARARIEWLEGNIRSVSPAFDFLGGPQVDFGFLDVVGHASSPGTQEIDQHPPAFSQHNPSLTSKRQYSSISDPPPQEEFADEARSVALDLGLLTLNSDSRQTHYLGTSSGRLFTSLIGAVSPETVARAPVAKTPRQPSFSSPGRPGPFAHAKRTKESCRMVYESLRKGLPSEEDAQVLLEVYFRNVHIDHPFLHPHSLLKAVEALYECAAADGSAEIGYNGWVDAVQPFTYNGEFDVSRNGQSTPISIFTATFHVFMVFTLAATVRTRQRTYDFAPNQFYRIAMSAGQHCFSSTSISSLQATLLLAVYSLLSPAELNIWTLTYVAMAHCVDLGLHRTPDTDSELSQATLLTRKMLFFSVYHLDRSISAIQGRPLGIRDETFDLQLPTVEDVQTDTDMIQGKALAPEFSLTGGLAFALHRFKLDPIISEIKLLFYHLPSQVSAYAWPSNHSASQAALQQRLSEWRHDLSTIADALNDASEGNQQEYNKYKLKLTSQYFAAMILLYQPSQVVPQPAEQPLLICYQCAASRLNTYNDLYHADSFFQSWRSVQGVFSSGATMIYCLWTSPLVRQTIQVSEAIRDLRTCTNLLSVGGEWWPSVKKGKESFGRAMDALLKKLDSNQSHGRYESTQDGRPPSQRPSHTSHQAQFPAEFASFTVPDHDVNLQQDEHRAFDAPSTDMTHFPHVSSDFTTADWTILDDPAFNHDPQGISGTFPVHGLDANESTVEAFIAEFLSNDTAWNPF